MNLGVVILNYLNFEDTIDCVESLKKQSYFPKMTVIVDNHSNNDSFQQLKHEYEHDEDIHVLQTLNNLGFAQGNNAGIKYCLEHDADTVLVLNNDILFNDSDYLLKLSQLRISENVGLIGTKIIGKNGVNQNPVPVKNTLFNIVRRINYLYLSETKFYKVVKRILGRNSTVEKSEINNSVVHNSTNINDTSHVMLHGSAMIFTRNFFDKYRGMYPETFLYVEENILDFMLKKAGLVAQYIDTLSLKHKEDQSSQKAFGNKESVFLEHMKKSTVIALKVYLMTYRQISKKIASNYETLSYVDDK
ncbi:glycosyltransferase family 2 protein [Lactobacillus sp. YT155]|uniref:glycosyltransferase n=1 Tax=Lactobacillus sp. YT155 TaxID=3060955 RepID=UPI00265DCC80|nr:glycosyltransferase family 2 protein [Lactobacillus sp. YT155]MDO1605234.1 glycosyltransferase family 2 protein [Lactobacillus sp. YT155]